MAKNTSKDRGGPRQQPATSKSGTYALLKSLLIKNKTFVLYTLIGGTGALMDLLAFLFLFNVLRIDPIIATSLSVTIGITNNFILNSLFNFRVTDGFLKRFVSFYAVGIFGLLLSIAIIALVHHVLGVDANIAKLVSIPVIVVVQYYLNSRISFGDIEKLRHINKSNVITGAILAVLYALFMSQSGYFGFSDEYDNILGGWLISTHGQLPYVDFFSHHMPLPYFLSAAITLFTDNDLGAFRVVFMNLLFAWTLAIFFRAKRVLDRDLSVLLVFLIASAQYMIWSHMMLAETLIAYATIHALVILADIYTNNQSIRTHEITLLSLLCATITLSSLSYLPVAMLLYGALAFLAIRTKLPSRSLIRGGLIVAAPYGVLGIYLALTRSLSEFIDQVYAFNKSYYSLFTNDVGQSMAGTLNNATFNLTNGLEQLFGLSGNAPVNLVNLVAALLCITLVVYLFMRRWYVAACFLTGLVFFSAYRGQVLTEVFTNPPTRPAVYGMVVLLLAVTGLAIARKQGSQKDEALEKTVRTTIGLLSLVAIVTITISAISLNTEIARTKNADIETSLQLNEKGGDIAATINKVTSPDDYYWIGPFDFYTQLYIDAKRSSAYTFYLPWHASCPTHNAELISSFETQKPKVIYWQPGLQIFGRDVDTFDAFILDYLKKNYSQIDDPDFANYYFINAAAPDIQATLRNQ